ncbi:MAG: 4Fe-4S dicluster domain-containing protein [Syntrophomonadaceae bacterium]
MAMVDYYRPLRLNEVNTCLQEEIEEACGVDIEMCMECGKCSGGCSNAHIFDFTPRKIIQLVKLGDEERLLNMDSLWTCVGCQLCVDRCPSHIDIPNIMDHLREKARRRNIKARRDSIEIFYDLMLDSIRKTGRVAEAPLTIKHNLRTRQYLKDADLGRRMLFKGKLKPFSPKVKDVKQVRNLFTTTIDQKEG